MDRAIPVDADDCPPPADEDHLHGQHKPLDAEEKLEEGLRETMDGSDPPTATHPGDHGEPVPSSGFCEEEDGDSARADQP
jgi:hypothetical protein